MEAKKAREDRLEFVKEQLDLCTHEVKQNIKEIAGNVERQVGKPSHHTQPYISSVDLNPSSEPS